MSSVDDTSVRYFWSGQFSNWYPAKFTACFYDGGPRMEFNCSEQFMMAYKASFFSDTEVMDLIMESDDPSQQKHLGRIIKSYSDPEWNSVARDATYIGVYEKFLQNAPLKKILVDTKNDLIVEASPVDSKWGIGYDSVKAPKNRVSWGKNWLGQVLMKVRDDIRNGECSSYTTIDWKPYTLEYGYFPKEKQID